MTAKAQTSPFWAFAAYALALAVLALSLIYAANRLPPQIAIHFDLAGHANRWASRPAQLATLGALGLLLPGGLLALCALARHLPPGLMNVPHPEYWRDPEHFPIACAMIRRAGIWMAAALTLWVAVLVCLVARANQTRPAHFDSGAIWIADALLVAYILTWVWQLTRFFRELPPL